ncbi:MAG: CRISPR-associated protein Csx11, partial [Nitrososphaerota archaeon]|nr:CRISPR-associated protein Csx11 [Nitrososphaerota archaeon]
VALFDHSYSAASLFKAELARRVIMNDWAYKEESYDNLKFQLLAVKWSWWDVVSKSYKTTDILGRDQLLDVVADDFKKLFEVDFPMGNEIYRDEDGIYFVIGNYKTEELKYACNEWMRPKINPILQKVGGEFSFGLYTLKTPTRSMTSLVDAISQDKSKLDPVASFGQEDVLLEAWSSSRQTTGSVDICPVCRLRPKPQHAKACRFCISLRQSGAKGGREKLEEELHLDHEFTKWTGELADENSTIAMISGKFDLTHWFDGSFFTTLFGYGMQQWSDGKTDNFSGDQKAHAANEFKEKYNDPTPYSKALRVLQDSFKEKVNWKFIQAFFSGGDGEENLKSTVSSDMTSRYADSSFLANDLDYALNLVSRKYPSSGRVRRVWRATEDFINGFIGGQGYQNGSLVETLGMRSRIQFRVKDGVMNLEKGYYDVTTERLQLAFSDVYHNGGGLFSIVENLGSSPRKDQLDALKGASLILLREDGTQTTLTIDEVIVDSNDKYLPFTPLLISPAMFQVLVPGEAAMEVVQLIKREYERQFNKVKNRLPLDLGVVFFKKKFPLYVVIDAARKMMEMGNNRADEWWKVEHKVAAPSPDQPTTDQEQKESGTITSLKLVPGPTTLFSVPREWQIDGRTLDKGIEDQFYPYFFVEDNAAYETSGSYRRSYSDRARWHDSEYTGEPVVLARDLKESTKTKVRPSYFDFELMDSTGRRYDLWYNKARVRKHHTLGSRKPYYLDDIELFEKLKDILVENLDGRAAIKRLYTLIQTKFDEWRDPFPRAAQGTNPPNPVLEGYVEDVITNVFGTDRWNSLSVEKRDLVKGACLSGAFFDCVDLYDSILKIDWATQGTSNPQSEVEKNELVQQ